MVLASAAFATMGVFVKLASATHHAFEIVLWRGLLGTAMLAGWGALRGEHFVGERFGAHLTRSLVGAVSLTGWYYALTHLPLATAMTLNYTSPLFIAAIVVGVAGATSETGPILAAGAAGLVGGAVSMALGEYVSVSSQSDSQRALIEKERRELAEEPEEELAELTAIQRAALFG